MFTIHADQIPLYIPGNPYRTVAIPFVTAELGKAGSLTCDLLPNNDLYGEMNKLRTKVECLWDGERIFDGRFISEEKNFDNIRSIYCEGNLSYLVDSVQKTEAYTGTTHGFFRKVIEKHNERVDKEKRFKIGIVEIEDREIVISGKTDDEGDVGEIDYRQIAINSMVNEWLTTLDLIQNCLIDYCGGYLRARREEDGLYIDLITSDGEAISQEIEFGVNLLDMTEEITAEELFTVLIPLGDENLTIETVNNGSDELIDEDAVAKYGRIVRTHVFDNVNQASTLLENGRRYLENQSHIPKTISISAIDLHFLNPDLSPIHIGDRVRVKSAPHGMSDILLCVKIEYDIEKPENTLYTFGTARQTLTERYRKDKRKTQESIAGSVGRGGGGAGKAAKAKAEKDAIEHVFKEWIDFDSENPDAHISLGGLHEQYKDAIQILEEQVGLDMSGTGSNVNLYTFRKKYDEFEQEIQSQRAQINLKIDEAFSQIENSATFIKKAEDGKLIENVALFKVRADELGSLIEAQAKKIRLHAEEIEMKASKTYVDNLIVKQLEAIKSSVKIDISEVVTTNIINVRTLNIGGTTVKRTPIEVVTDFTQASKTSYTFLTV